MTQVELDSLLRLIAVGVVSSMTGVVAVAAAVSVLPLVVLVLLVLCVTAVAIDPNHLVVTILLLLPRQTAMLLAVSILLCQLEAI